MPPRLKYPAYALLLMLTSVTRTYAQGNCSPSGCYGINQIISGDFESFSNAAPFADFTSDYTFNGPCVSGGNGCGDYLCQFSFAVNSLLTTCNITWSPSIQDHTSGTGNMMVVDFPNNGPEQKIWCTQVTLEPNKEYCFGAWFINLLEQGSNQGQPAFSFRVNGNNLYNSPSVPEDEQWHFYGASFNSGAGGITDICIYNQNWGFLGYDVAIDDIVLREVTAGQEPELQDDNASLCTGSGSVVVPVLQNDIQGINPPLDASTLTVSVPPPFSDGTISNINTSNGTITFTPATGFSGSTSFIYSVCNGSGCCSEATVTIQTTLNPDINISAASAIICQGDSTQLSANGAISYQWSPAIVLSSSTGAMVMATPITNTNFTVVGIDANGCSDSANIFITVSPTPEVQLSVYDASICEGDSVAITISGANNYTWVPNSNAVAGTSDYFFFPNTNTTYTITGTLNGCDDDTTLMINVLPSPQINLTPAGSALICNGDSIAVTITGVNSFTWGPMMNTSLSNQILTLFPTTSTTYTITGTDASNCSASNTLNIDVINNPLASIDCPDSLCIGSATIENNSQSTTDYRWFLNNVNLGTFETLNYEFTDSGLYFISLIASNNNSCFDTTNCTIQVLPYPIILSVSGVPEPNSFSASISLQSEGSDSCYLLINDEIVSLDDCDSTLLTYEFPGSGEQNLSYITRNDYGCITTYNFTVTINDATFIYVPNAFSPNADGINDEFIPWFIKTPSFYTMSIYDRWGKKVFESNSISKGWDGNYINGAAALGVYVYVIQYALPGYTERKILKGNVSLLK